jgi:hypothetical protein
LDSTLPAVATVGSLISCPNFHCKTYITASLPFTICNFHRWQLQLFFWNSETPSVCDAAISWMSELSSCTSILFHWDNMYWKWSNLK